MADYPNQYKDDLFKLALMQHIESFGEDGFKQKFSKNATDYLNILNSKVPFRPDEAQNILSGYNDRHYKDFYKKSDELAQEAAEGKEFDKNFDLINKIGSRIELLQKNKSLSDVEAAALFDTTPEIFNEVKYIEIIDTIYQEEISQETVNGIYQKAATYFNDPQLSRLCQKLDASYVPSIEDSGIGNVVKSVATARVTGPADQIEKLIAEKPIKDLLATKFINNFGKVDSRTTEEIKTDNISR